jgi:transmembrane sensor
MDDQKIIELLHKRNTGELSAMEKAQLEGWYNDYLAKSNQQPSSEELKNSIANLQSRLPLAYNKPVRKLWIPVSIAASFLILISIGLMLYQQGSFKIGAQKYANDIAPGRNAATLTLADGRKISLSDAAAGELAKQQGVDISKTKDGKLVYKISGAGSESVAYNTLNTTNGEQVEIVLPDGTAVWLNAASQLKFPTTFAGQKNRKVELIGEGYFEVFKNKMSPFIVQTNKQEVEVLGTHFNISNYADDKETKTTLLEGSVKVNQIATLRPGEQASGFGNHLKITKVDTELSVAWKNNKFMFEKAQIQDIMKMVKRWYNVDIVYADELPEKLYTGSVSRFEHVSKVLEILELTGNVHFKIEGRRIIVMK